MLRTVPNPAGARWRALVLLATIGCPPTLAAQSISYPVARRESVVDDYHGTSVADPYRWLEQLDSPETTAWLEAENRLSARYLERTASRAAIRRRLAALSDFERTNVPWREAGRLFYAASAGG